MNYKRYIESTSSEFEVNEHVINSGNTTWQISNIAATSVSKKEIPFNEPEPTFTDSEPEFNFGSIGGSFVFAAIAWAICRFFFDLSLGAVIVAVAVVCLFILTAYSTYGDEQKKWKSDKAEVEREWEIWNKIKQNPPVLYSLMLETNAGSKPLFYSFDEAQIIKAKNAVDQSMQNENSKDVKLEIETVNIGGNDSINNFASKIYEQSIQEG
ncbi:hypothetical protein [Maridesulfovibrio salexigens]|uniref:Uncharacterized protein n=1 Tax=Maridesulfovibrio salexigens (strain ATCC 14822 / DSM 2638 / NCIMB 8403 / VKM B-1763) TaxID=526222 RepID=C6BZB6_MARSD|nr:hypothetical protein [Maridesulfovibrio salexigens]ACS80753.1 hypothetical protein Desal_2699 [Maridesulfovibrio salexigens DSM 2638]